MSLPGSTPLQSFLGGVCVAFPVHALLSFNNNTFGISGFIHGAARGRLEDAMSVLGLILGGVVVAVIEGDKPTVGDSSPIPLILSGLLVGAGTKHVAPLPGDPSLGAHGGAFLASGLVALVSTLVASQTGVYARRAVALCSAVGFAFALRLSNLTDARRVLGFLLTPAHAAFDPSLAYLAIGAIPLTSLLYRMGTVRVQPKKGKVDGRLLVGAALFGVGRGIEGICRKPSFWDGMLLDRR
ncbi:hypothetical protein V8E53_002651 [Lactarius tabidus]